MRRLFSWLFLDRNSPQRRRCHRRVNPIAAVCSAQVLEARRLLSGTAASDAVVGASASLDGTTVTVNGTLESNVVTVTETSTLTIVVDGVTYQYNAAEVTAIEIFGSDGNDSIVVNSLSSGTALQILGENGNDSITVNGNVADSVTLDGGDGNDLLIGGGGNDALVGGIGNDWLNGGAGYDTLSGDIGNDVYEFSDTLFNEIDKVFEQADSGTDLLSFTAITSAVSVDLTSDASLAGMGHRIVQTGAAGQAANFENVNGGTVNDFIVGNAANNTINGNGGNDTLKGGDGNDQISGGAGNDLLVGGAHDDYLIGELGDDFLKGELGNDYLQGNDGFNVLIGRQGNDTYLFTNSLSNHIDTLTELAGEGTDTLSFAAVTTAVTIDLANDALLASGIHQIVSVAAAGQSANFESATGGSANDQILGNAADNVLSGGDGNDTITGGGGRDILLGGAGQDTLKVMSGRSIQIGGAGGDLLTGGSDDDVLIGDTSIYETNPGGLNAIFNEWNSSASYRDRFKHLYLPGNGGLNQGWYLNDTTITDDGATDYHFGGVGDDFMLSYTSTDVFV